MKILGTIFIISAPSGTGKSSLINKFLKKKYLDNISVSVSYTTREQRNGEINGIHYHFISTIKFKYLIKKNFFLEYAVVFGHFYGTAIKSLQILLKKGIDVFLDIDWQGAQNIKKKIPDSKSIFVLPPSKKILFNRLKTRNRDNKKIILRRLKECSIDISHLNEYDYLLVNDNFLFTLNSLYTIIFSNRLLLKKQKFIFKDLIFDLLS